MERTSVAAESADPKIEALKQRQLLGKPVVLGFLGTAVLACYGGVRKKNSWFSLMLLLPSFSGGRS